MDKIHFYYNGFEPILRIIIVGTITYIAIIFLIRISGKRTLATMNGFDFIITIAIGSAFGRILTAQNIPIAEAITAFALLVILQTMVSWIKMKSPKFGDIITAPPSLLFYQGRFIHENLKKERINEDEVKSAVRQQKVGSMEEIEAVIFESTGSFSIIKKSMTGDEGSSYKKVIEDNKK